MKYLFLLVTFTIFLAADVDIKKEIIQVGAFKNKSSIQNLKKKLSNYEILVKNYPNKLKKVFVINITKKTLANKLKSIKVISPDAFVLSKKKKLELTNLVKPNNWFKKTFRNSNTTNRLDSKAIIKTRKKFFK